MSNKVALFIDILFVVLATVYLSNTMPVLFALTVSILIVLVGTWIADKVREIIEYIVRK